MSGPKIGGRSERTWAWADPENGSGCSQPGGLLWFCAAFIYLSEMNTFPKGCLPGGQTRETYTYANNTRGPGMLPLNGFGQLLTATYHGVSNSALDDRRTEYTYFQPDQNLADPYLVLPKTAKVVDPNTSAILRSTINYYDNRCDTTTLPTRGLLTSTSTQIDTAPTQWANVHVGYDDYGNRDEQTIPTVVACVTSGLPAGVPKTTWTFDTAFHALLTQVANAMPTPQLTTYTYDAAANGILLGKPTKVAPPDGHWVETRYDSFGRPDRSWDIVDSDAYPTEKYTYTWGAGSNKTSVLRRVSPGASGTTRQHVACQDGVGRVFMTLSPYGSSAWPPKNAEVRTDYDARGNKAAVSNPVTLHASDVCDTTAISTLDRTIFGYDTLGNTSVTTFLAANQLFGGSSRRFEYNGLSSNRINENNHRVVETINPGANQTVVKEQTGTTVPWADYSITTYTRDRLGQLMTVVDNDLNTTTLTYYMGGRKRTMSDPDMGNWLYTYDVRGNLLTQNDARGVQTALAYDNLDRLSGKTYTNDPSGTPAVTYSYDSYVFTAGYVACSGAPGLSSLPVGQLTAAVSGTAKSYHCYDDRMRTIRSKHEAGGSSYVVNRTYNGLSAPKTVTYPDSEVVTNGYDENGNLASLAAGSDTIYSAIALKPSMQPSTLMHPGGLITSYAYDFRMRVTYIQTQGLERFDYTYDDASNVKTLHDGISGGPTTTFTYDDLERLTKAENGGYDANYEYSPIGNMTAKNEAQAVALNYPAAGQPRPHAVSNATIDGAGPAYLTYDSNGNMLTSSTGETFTYDAENRVKTRYTGGSLGLTYTYTYGAGGELVQRVETGGAQTKTVTYVGGVYEKEVVSDGGATTITKYYHAFGRAVAVRKGTALSYLYADQLGSTTAAWAVATGTLTTQRYWPYGATRTGGLAQTDKLYTGQQQEQADYLGLYNYKARFYSTTLGRFVSADPVVPDGSGVGLNRYAYGRNSPLAYVDPSGHSPLCVCPNWTPQELNVIGFYAALRDEGWQAIGYESGSILFGTAGTIYVLPNSGIQMSNQTGVRLALAAGTFVLAYQVAEVVSGVWNKGVVVVNSTTSAIDMDTGEPVNFYERATAFTQLFQNGYLYYTQLEGAIAVSASGQLGRTPGETVYFTKDVALTEQEARDRFLLDPDKTYDAVLAFEALEPHRISGPRWVSEYPGSTPQFSQGREWWATAPLSVAPGFIVRLPP